MIPSQPMTHQQAPVMTAHQVPKLLQQKRPHHLIRRRKDVRLNWLNLKKLKLKKQTDVPKKRGVIQNMWPAINRLSLTETTQIHIEPDHKAHHQPMWHRVAAVKLMKWHRAVQRPAAKVPVVANLAK